MFYAKNENNSKKGLIASRVGFVNEDLEGHDRHWASNMGTRAKEEQETKDPRGKEQQEEGQKDLGPNPDSTWRKDILGIFLNLCGPLYLNYKMERRRPPLTRLVATKINV